MILYVTVTYLAHPSTEYSVLGYSIVGVSRSNNSIYYVWTTHLGQPSQVRRGTLIGPYFKC